MLLRIVNLKLFYNVQRTKRTKTTERTTEKRRCPLSPLRRFCPLNFVKLGSANFFACESALQRGRADGRRSAMHAMHGQPERRCVGSMSFQLCLRLGFYNPKMCRNPDAQTVFGSSEIALNEQIPAIFPLLRVKVDYFLISSPFFGARCKRPESSENSAFLWILIHPQLWVKVGKMFGVNLVDFISSSIFVTETSSRVYLLTCQTLIE